MYTFGEKSVGIAHGIVDGQQQPQQQAAITEPEKRPRRSGSTLGLKGYPVNRGLVRFCHKTGFYFNKLKNRVYSFLCFAYDVVALFSVNKWKEVWLEICFFLALSLAILPVSKYVSYHTLKIVGSQPLKGRSRSSLLVHCTTWERTSKSDNK